LRNIRRKRDEKRKMIGAKIGKKRPGGAGVKMGRGKGDIRRRARAIRGVEKSRRRGIIKDRVGGREGPIKKRGGRRIRREARQVPSRVMEVKIAADESRG
jgi:hypothetical protein